MTHDIAYVPERDGRRLRSTLVIVLVLGLTGCRHVRPWERGQLAHPSMTTAGAPPPAAEHVYSVQERATGGGGAAESGCGCN